MFSYSPPPQVKYVLNGWLQESSQVTSACFRFKDTNFVHHSIMADCMIGSNLQILCIIKSNWVVFFVRIREAKILVGSWSRLTVERCVISLWVAPISYLYQSIR